MFVLIDATPLMPSLEFKNMTKYDFRIKFIFSQDTSIDIDTDELLMLEDTDGKKLFIRSGCKGQPIKDFSTAAIIGSSYPTKEEAMNAALQVKTSLLLWAVQQRTGIDFGDGRLRSVTFDAGKRLLEEQFKCSIRDDLHGIDIYEHQDKIMFVNIDLKVKKQLNSNNFLNSFLNTFKQHINPTEKQLLASELFCASFFDTSFRSKFITLVTSIEALLELNERSEVEKDFIVELSNLVQQSILSDETKHSIQGSLKGLKYESIGQGGKKLSKLLLGDHKYAGMSADNFFTYCYNLRSQILHSGKPDNSSIDILEVTNILQEFVLSLLNSSFGLLSK